MSKISPLSGFPELLPAQRAVEREVIASVSRTFELHGFANIETRVVEPIDRLAKGGEVDKEIYVLQRLQAERHGGGPAPTARPSTSRASRSAWTTLPATRRARSPSVRRTGATTSPR